MKWTLTLIFLVFMLFTYLHIGELALEICGYKKITNIKSIVLGYFLFFSIGFFVGVPCLILHTSWRVFFIINSICYLIFLVAIYYTKREKIVYRTTNFLKNWKSIILNNIKNYWVLYVMVLILTVLSMSNQMPYYKTNYDDHYYIGKIVQQIEIPQLLSEDFFSGSIVDMSKIAFERYFNTYELMYSYLLSIFQLPAAYFCRATMVIHNYLLTLYVYYALAEEFIDKKYVQYTLLVFCLFFISFGYYNFQKEWIRMYDGWQFQSAIFYGGSVVRVMSIPTLILFGKELIDKFDLKRLVLLALIYFSFLSFSTIFLQPAIIITYLFILVKLIKLFIDKKYNWKYGLLILLYLGLLYGTTKLGNLSFFSIEKYQEFMNDYLPFHTHYVGVNMFYKYCFIILFINFFIINDTEYRLINVMIIFMYIMFRNNVFTILNAISCMFIFFVPLRTIASVEHMLLFVLSIELVFIFIKLRANRTVCNIAASIVLISSLSFFGYLYDDIIKQDFLGSGVSIDGYSVKRIIENDEMTPGLFVEIGNHFNQLEYGNYRLLASDYYYYDNSTIDSSSLVFASNRIETCYRGGCKMTGEEYSNSIQYFHNTMNYEEFKNILLSKDIDYVLINDESQKIELESNGFQIELTYQNNNNLFYLMKCPF